MTSRDFLPVPLLLALAACGGAGTGGNFTPPPPPPPPPPPAPEPAADPEPIPYSPLGLAYEEGTVTFGVDQTTGYEAETQGWFSPGAVTQNDVSGPGDVVTLTYDGAEDVYTMTISRLGSGTLDPRHYDGTPGQVAKYTRSALLNEQGGYVAEIAMPNPATTGYAYSHFGRWSSIGTYENGDLVYQLGQFVTGLETPADGIPVTGVATYSADVMAYTPALFMRVSGEASLAFDFGAGSLSGWMRVSSPGDEYYAEAPVDFGTYDFAETIFSAGSARYSGMFAQNGVTISGSFFDGSLTGPNAEEVIGRFALPFVLDGTDWDLTGVWIGRR